MPFQATAPRSFLDFYTQEALVKENDFLKAKPDRAFPPSFAESVHLLPAPWIESNGSASDGVDESMIAMYWKAWDLAFRNLRKVQSGNGFIQPFIDTAFNDCLFMWDSCFILLFARYGHAAFDFQRTLDNLYAKQHPDGFISREVQEWDGQDRFHRFDPASTGPNILAWCEWQHWLNNGDKDRLARVFPVLLAYHRWLARHRRWPDGSYWCTGLACGMDNQPRVQAGDSAWVDHSNTAWIDATCQAVLDGQLLLSMSAVVGQEGRAEMEAVRDEVDHLRHYINEKMWDEKRAFYTDVRLGGPQSALCTHSPGPSPQYSETMTIGAYWCLLAGVVPEDRLQAFCAPLDDPAHFNRVCRPASLSASHPEYASPRGGYWLGGVWPSTTYMVLRGLTQAGRHDQAADIAANWMDNCAAVYRRTGTIWENMAPDLHGEPGDPAKGDFVGWGGLVVAVLMEYLYGLRADVPSATLTWDIRLLRGFGVLRYPFGRAGIVHLQVSPRASLEEPPVLHVSSTVALTLKVQWGKCMTAVGGQAMEQPRSHAQGPIHERVLSIVPNMDASEAAAAPVSLPPHLEAARVLQQGSAGVSVTAAATLEGAPPPVAMSAAGNGQWMRVSGVRPADSPRAAQFKVNLR